MAYREAAAAAGAITPLLRSLGSSSAACHDAPACALCNIDLDAAGHQAAAVSAGSLPMLVRMLSSGNEGSKEHAAGALANIACASNQHR